MKSPLSEYEVVSTTKGPNGEEVSVLTTNQTHTAVENLKPESRYVTQTLSWWTDYLMGRGGFFPLVFQLARYCYCVSSSQSYLYSPISDIASNQNMTPSTLRTSIHVKKNSPKTSFNRGIMEEASGEPQRWDPSHRT